VLDPKIRQNAPEIDQHAPKTTPKSANTAENPPFLDCATPDAITNGVLWLRQIESFAPTDINVYLRRQKVPRHLRPIITSATIWGGNAGLLRRVNRVFCRFLGDFGRVFVGTRQKTIERRRCRRQK